MAKSTEVVFEGWLTKSPPSKRIWRARWRRRWFLLTHSADIPGQYVLKYYTDRNYRKLKGVIDLDHCEQVDVGLKLDKRDLKFDHVFDIKVPNRTYYLAADSEEEMKSWVTCICRVCGLTSTNIEEESGVPMNAPDIEITEEIVDDKSIQINETPPVSPVSSSPYIPISECITGKSPVYDPKDFRSLAEYNQRFSTGRLKNESYEFHPQNSYVNLSGDPERNYVNDLAQDPRFYDCPRQLAPPANKVGSNQSPLLSPTDSDNVFHDADWTPQQEPDGPKKVRPSTSSVELDQNSAIKSGGNQQTLAPPRPPKPAHITPPPCYLNLSPVPKKTSKESGESGDPSISSSLKIITDETYDIPRSHNIETEHDRHYYNNAAPVKCPEGTTVFRYDVSPKPSTSSVTSVFRYDLEATQELEPSSPAHSHSSSTHAYSNLPSPDSQLMPPPTVNRDLKPRRKLSDTHSTCSNTEPPSPRTIAGPSVDRKLKPPTPLQEANRRKSFHVTDEEGTKKIRAAPSPTPPGRIDDTYENQDVYLYINNKMQYLDLDLEGAVSSNSSVGTATKSLPKANTVYKKVDFVKTQAFNITRNNLEKERQEHVITTFVKK